ncbi:MAG: TetR/AcrR family transcriptional regulator [Candidatus Omnitrophota bacterium]
MNANSLIEDKFMLDKASTSLSRRQRDRLLRQADILKAAEHVFALKGYYEATMQDIAKEAQYATGTVYLYFKDKDALYLSLVESKYKDLLSILKEETSKTQSVRVKLEILIREKLSFFERNRDFFRIFISERNKSVGRFHKLAVVSQHREFIAQLIGLAQEEHILRKEYPCEKIAEIFISILMSVVFNWLKDENKREKDLTRMSGFVLNMFINGAGKN